MTLPPEKIGYNGQRYSIRAYGYPLKDKWNLIGYGNDLDHCRKVRDAMVKRPGCADAIVYDIKARKTVSDQ